VIEGELACEFQKALDEDAESLPGAQAAVFVPGKGLWVGATGSANLESGGSVTRRRALASEASQSTSLPR
jgi:hypothetical protein